jgi:hypothetical protein
MTVPLYSYENEFQGYNPERYALKRPLKLGAGICFDSWCPGTTLCSAASHNVARQHNRDEAFYFFWNQGRADGEL